MAFEWLHGILPDTALDPLFGQSTLKSREKGLHAYLISCGGKQWPGYPLRICLRTQGICLLLSHFKLYWMSNTLFPSFKFGGGALALPYTEATPPQQSKHSGYHELAPTALSSLSSYIHVHKCQLIRQAAVQASC